MLRRLAILILAITLIPIIGCSTLQTTTNPSAGQRTAAAKRSAVHKVSATKDSIPNAAEVGL